MGLDHVQHLKLLNTFFFVVKRKEIRKYASNLLQNNRQSKADLKVGELKYRNRKMLSNEKKVCKKSN